MKQCACLNDIHLKLKKLNGCVENDRTEGAPIAAETLYSLQK
jgi:hypothetical protein